MKIIQNFVLLLSCVLILTACPPINSSNEGLKKLKAHNYNFSDFKRFYYKGIYFYLPDYFTQDYNTAYQYKKDGISLSNYGFGVYFSCERFDKNEAKDFLFTLEDSITELEAVHQFYIQQRINSLQNAKISLKHKKDQNSSIKGIYQIVKGSRYEYSNKLVYMIGTVEKKGYYYVFQFISSKEMSAYLFDDFKRILKKLK